MSRVDAVRLHYLAGCVDAVAASLPSDRPPCPLCIEGAHASLGTEVEPCAYAALGDLADAITLLHRAASRVELVEGAL